MGISVESPQVVVEVSVITVHRMDVQQTKTKLVVIYTKYLTTKDLCGNNFYVDSKDGIILINQKLTKFSMCEWSIQLYKPKDISKVNLEVQYSENYKVDIRQIGELYIRGYDETSINQIIYEYDSVSMNYKNLFEIKDVSYIVIVYYTTEEDEVYSPFKAQWNVEYDTSDEDKGSYKLLNVLEIVGPLFLGCFLIACTAFSIWRCVKIMKRNNRVQVTVRMISSQIRRRETVYEILDDFNSSISIQLIEVKLPERTYEDSLLEVGEKTCCVCFDE